MSASIWSPTANTPAQADSTLNYSGIYTIIGAVLTRYTTLAEAITGLGSSVGSIIIRANTTLTANATIPVTATLEIQNRAQITLGGFNLTITGDWILHPNKCFNGTGNVTFGGQGKELRPQWWGALADNVNDDAAAIMAADAAACSGTLGLDGVTVASQHMVFFSPGSYRHNSTLTYRGAPWIGSGVNNTFIRSFTANAAAVNAVGTNSARKMLDIRSITFEGTDATGTSYGFRLGYNQRSFPAFVNVRIDKYPGPGIIFGSPTWSMSFQDLYLSFNAADSLFSGIYQDPAVVAGDLVALEFYNLQLENNGVVGSGKAGGMELRGCQGLRFFGGVWEGNYGSAEVLLTDAEGFWIFGGHIESDVGSVDHGFLALGASYGSIYGMTNTAEAGFAGAGAAIYVGGTSIITLDQIRSDGDWITNLAVADTARVNLVGEGVLPVINIAGSGQVHRHTPKRFALTDAATIATVATNGTTATVTLGGNRTVGAPTNVSIGQRLTYIFTQDGTGGRTVTWNAVFLVTWSNTGNTAGKKSSITFEYDGTNWIQIGAQSPYN
jgi:hypothetical protein